MSVRLISSRDNAQYKQLRQLATSGQARRKSGRTLLDGVHLCEAWLAHRGAPLLCAIGESARCHPEAGRVLGECDRLGTECIVLPDALFSPVSQVEHGVPLVFVVALPEPEAGLKVDCASLLLDGLQDPGNLGSILRSAAAAGVKRVFCGQGTVAAWSPKVMRAGMGAHFILDIIEDADLAALVAEATVPVFATSSHASTSIHEADLRAPSAWLFGHEGQGVSPALLASATQQLTIPQSAAIESLNVAASVAICLFEQLRQQRSSAFR